MVLMASHLVNQGCGDRVKTEAGIRITTPAVLVIYPGNAVIALRLKHWYQDNHTSSTGNLPRERCDSVKTEVLVSG